MFALLKKIWLGIDGFILSGCQKISDKVYEKTGSSNLAIARILLYIAALMTWVMFLIIALYRDNLTDFGRWWFCIQMALMCVLVSLSLLMIKNLGFIATDSLYDHSEEMKMIQTKWGKSLSGCRRIFLGTLIAMFSMTFWSWVTTDVNTNPFHNPLNLYMYLAMLFLPLCMISEYFSSCKTISPFKGRVALMVGG